MIVSSFFLCLSENIINHSRSYTATFDILNVDSFQVFSLLAFVESFHSMRLPWSSLSISEYRCMVTLVKWKGNLLLPALNSPNGLFLTSNRSLFNYILAWISCQIETWRWNWNFGWIYFVFCCKILHFWVGEPAHSRTLQIRKGDPAY